MIQESNIESPSSSARFPHELQAEIEVIQGSQILLPHSPADLSRQSQQEINENAIESFSLQIDI